MDSNERPANFNGLDDEFMLTPTESRQQTERAQSEAVEASADDVEALRSITETQLSPTQEAEFDRLAQDKFGMSAAQLKLQIATAIHLEQSAKEEHEANVFLASEPTYQRTPENSDKLIGFLKEQGLPLTSGSLRYAFHTLTEAGVIKNGTQRQPASVGLSDRVSARQDYSGESEPFDADAFRSLSSDARKMYAEMVHRAERKGEKAPTVQAFAQSYKRNRMD